MTKVVSFFVSAGHYLYLSACESTHFEAFASPWKHGRTSGVDREMGKPFIPVHVFCNVSLNNVIERF